MKAFTYLLGALRQAHSTNLALPQNQKLHSIGITHHILFIKTEILTIAYFNDKYQNVLAMAHSHYYNASSALGALRSYEYE
jgi:hypothetical protein